MVSLHRALPDHERSRAGDWTPDKRRQLKASLIGAVLFIGWFSLALHGAPWWIWLLACAFVGFPLFLVLTSQLASDGGYTSLVDTALCPSFPCPGRGAVLVTGASRGLGRAAAIELAAAGYTVLGTVRSKADADALARAGPLPPECEGCILPTRMDQIDQRSIDAALSEVDERLAALEAQRSETMDLVAVVCNAGVTTMGPVEGLPLDEFLPAIETNVVGTMRVIKSLMPTIRENGARVVIIGAPDVPMPQYTHKSVCNGALAMLARSLRLELSGKHVSVSLVTPAAIKGTLSSTSHETCAALRAKHMSEELQAIYPTPRIFDGKPMAYFSEGWVSAAVLHAVDSRFPKTVYTTTPAGTAMYFLAALLPDRLLEKLVHRSMGPPSQ